MEISNPDYWSKLPLLAETVLQTVEERISTSNGDKNLTDEDLLSLHSVFGAILERSLEILDRSPSLLVYRTVATCQTLVEVKGESDRCYRIFPGINFCSCQAFKHQVTEKQAQVTCKHVLAARIALMTDKVIYQEITTVQRTILLHSMFDTAP